MAYCAEFANSAELKSISVSRLVVNWEDTTTVANGVDVLGLAGSSDGWNDKEHYADNGKLDTKQERKEKILFWVVKRKVVLFFWNSGVKQVEFQEK